jgi:hypothetical protein
MVFYTLIELFDVYKRSIRVLRNPEQEVV